MRTLSRTFVVSAVAAIAAGCAAPDAAQVPISDQASNAPLPRLVPTDRFSSALASAEPDTERLQADAAALAARAAALRARASALSATVLPAEARSRLEAAAEANQN